MNINTHFDYLAKTRDNLLRVVRPYSLEQLNKIPQGFNNNLIWNLAHCAVTQQLLVYGLTGTPMTLDDDIINAYRKGSKPMAKVDQPFVDMICQKLVSSVDDMRSDYQNKAFGDYPDYPTSYGIILSNVEEAINFNNLHEAMHLGNMMALRKLV